MNFYRTAAACPITNVADIKFNLENIKTCINNAIKKSVKLIVFPELCITSYTCADLFHQKLLLDNSLKAIEDLCEFSKQLDIFILVGAPISINNTLFNCAIGIFNGLVLGIVPKSYLPNYTEFYEKRWFTSGLGITNKTVNFYFQKDIPFGTDILFTCDNIKIGVEICEDLWVTIPPSSYQSLGGANVLCNLSASNEIVSKAEYRQHLVENQSARCIASYIYSSSGVLESTTDLVFSGHLIIAENGTLINQNSRFQRENELLTSILDIDKLNADRLKNLSFRDSSLINTLNFREIEFKYSNLSYGDFDRYVEKHPFVPSNKAEITQRCKEIFNIQSAGLSKRFKQTNLEKAIIGISGGLDSTLALLVIVKTFDLLKIDRKNIIAVTLPGFGTTDRTYNNAVSLCKNLNTTFREVDIVPACLQHFKDIDHNPDIHDITYENVQARERTQLLMDIANKEAGLLIGTGDLSELALGWCTYNGDHMSMYAVNCSIPKTLVRYLVQYVALEESDKNTEEILIDILNTPVSPELLPKDKEGNITQKTEDIIGPYELHDFFLFYFVRHGATPEKILFLAKVAFKNEYEPEFIDKFFNFFIKRFFTQQFKRSAIPDGPKVGSISLSPRGDWRMPSDASFNLWKS